MWRFSDRRRPCYGAPSAPGCSLPALTHPESRLDLEQEPEADLIGGVATDQQEYVDSTGVKRSVYLQEAEGQT